MEKKVAFFLGSMGRGGAERVISILANEYAKQGWNADIAILLSNIVDYELDEKIRILDFTGKTANRILRLPMWLKSIRNYVKTEKPDVIVSFVARINVLVLLACIGLKTKIVISERNDPTYDGRGAVTRLLTKLLYPKADKIIFQTQRVKAMFDKKVQDNGVVIPNPISVALEASEAGEKKIVSVGRLTKQKNQKMLIEAFAAAVKKHPEYSLTIYGEGDLRPELENKAKELGVSDKVFLPGNILRVHEEIANAEFFVLPSDYEGLSNALLEAMMMGLPCISTDCAGSDEYIESGKNGLLVPVGDGQAMKEAILYMIEHEEERKAFGKEAKRVSEIVSMENVMKKWHDVIG